MRLGRILLVSAVAGSLLVALPFAGEAKPRDRKTPRFKKAQMVDSDGDMFADKLVLTYNEKVRHKRDADGKYPFTVEGYEIASVGRAKGKKVSIGLVQATLPDGLEIPNVSYKRVKKQPVRDRARNQARKQVFRKTRPFSDAVIVTVNREGDGTVASLPLPSINCGDECRAAFPRGLAITLNPTGEVEWGGDCADAPPICPLVLDSDKTVSATFGGGDTFTLIVEKAGTGDAQILSVPPGIDCGETCTAEFAPNTPVALNASALIGSVTWSGCLDPTGLLPCTVIMDSDKTVTATFSGP
jgi:hypothetical protein